MSSVADTRRKLAPASKKSGELLTIHEMNRSYIKILAKFALRKPPPGCPAKTGRSFDNKSRITSQ